jgi:membrane protein YqaA with SNARE-associated domain
MELLSLAGIYAGTFLFCAMSGIVPLMNSELFMLYLGSTASHSQFPALILLAALGQMSAKVVLYYAGRGVLKLPMGRGQARIEALRTRLSATGQAAGGVTFVSALTGLPSFYAISVIAGTLGWPFSRFLAWGIAGRILRFSVLLFLPGIVKGVL